MGNETYYYFGAYLEIKVNQVEKELHFHGCKSGHRQNNRSGKFCSKCGELVGRQVETITEYPWHIYDILGEEWEDELSIITPHSMFEKGTILAKGNYSNRKNGEWLFLSRFDNDVDTKDFPTDEKISEMKTDFESSYAGIIAELKKSEAVVSVIIKAGFVLNEEY